jgi:hypothetical protein
MPKQEMAACHRTVHVAMHAGTVKSDPVLTGTGPLLKISVRRLSFFNLRFFNGRNFSIRAKLRMLESIP